MTKVLSLPPRTGDGGGRHARRLQVTRPRRRDPSPTHPLAHCAPPASDNVIWHWMRIIRCDSKSSPCGKSQNVCAEAVLLRVGANEFVYVSLFSFLFPSYPPLVHHPDPLICFRLLDLSPRGLVVNSRRVCNQHRASGCRTIRFPTRQVET